MLELTVLGSGTSVPSAFRLPPAYLVQADDQALLVDCGSGCSSSLARAGLTLDRLNGILLSHLHPDHSAELVPLLFALVNPAGPPRSAELPIWGPPGTVEHLQKLRGVYGRWVEPRQCEVAPRELGDGESWSLGALRIIAFNVEHGPAALAFRFEQAGRVLCYSGDSGLCPGLEAAAAGADLLLCECAALDEAPQEGHLSPGQVGQLASRVGCREVVLTHLYDQLPEPDLPALVQRHYPGPVRLAEDGLQLRIG